MANVSGVSESAQLNFFRGSFSDIAVNPPLFDEIIVMCVFVIPWSFFIWECFRRCSPCYIIDKRNRASGRTSNDDTPDPEKGSAAYTEAQRAKDKKEEAAIKQRAAKAAAGK